MRPSRSMSSANRKLQSGRPDMDSDESGMSVSSVWTSTVVRNISPTLPFSYTSQVASSYNDPMTSIRRLSMLYSFRARQTRSNTIELFLEVDEIMKEFVLMFQMLFHQQPEVEYMFSSTPQ